tara:strand:+ start:1608 stop:2066 length:459 start_codon:yes stop_codon:yes gene_type:complete
MASKKKTSFSINPIELIVFFSMATSLAATVYQVSHEGFQNFSHHQQTRELASEKDSPLATYVIKCPPTRISTQAHKIKLKGNMCSLKITPQKIDVTNITNKSDIHVFFEKNENRFSTDYFDLSPGENKISITYFEDFEKKITQEVLVERNFH